MVKITMKRGTTKVFNVTIEDETTGSLLSQTGGQMRFMVKVNVTDTNQTALIDKTFVCGDTSTSVSIFPADTNSLEPGDYFYELEYKNGDVCWKSNENENYGVFELTRDTIRP